MKMFAAVQKTRFFLYDMSLCRKLIRSAEGASLLVLSVCVCVQYVDPCSRIQ